MNLSQIAPGQSARVTAVGGEGALRQHFLDMGLIPGTVVTVEKHAPMGDPVELRLHDYQLTLRMDDAARIEVAPAQAAATSAPATSESKRVRHEAHPGLGEGYPYHVIPRHPPYPKNTKLRFGLAGNQNSGKTTLFNALTGANQHVGNFPGVTVDRKSGAIRGAANTEVTDLPGIYSMSPYSSEEVVSRRYILDEKPEAVINIVDATSIERSLYLTMQLMELDVPMVLALNMMDELTGNGGSIRINEMEQALGIPVVPISAAKNQGIEELVHHAVHVAQFREGPGRMDFCAEGSPLHRCIHAIMHLIDGHAAKAGIPVRFAATKLAAGDQLVLDSLGLSAGERETVESIIAQMERESGLDRAAAVADMRFRFITNLVRNTVVKPQQSKERERSRVIDTLLTGKYTALPVFAAIMALVFWLTFEVIGAYFQDLLEEGIEAVTEQVDGLLTAWDVAPSVQALVTDAVFGGVGSVLSFLPVIVTLFFFLSLMEDSGYMARVAFVMDRLLRKIGLSGRSIVPMLMGFGCSVPGTMATRTLPSERDRRMTVLLLPFMSCSAKLPIYAFFTSVFFPESAALVTAALYFGGVVVGILTALVLKNSLFRGNAVPFVMELPNYRMPGVRNVALLLWEKAQDFLTRAFTVIFAATVLIWFLESFDLHLNMVEDSGASILAVVAGFAAPLFGVMGLGDWRISTALVTGFLAKESVVSTLSVLFEGASLTEALTTPACAALLTFCLLYTPCAAAIASVRRELGGKWAALVVVGQCVIAWICALLVYWVASGVCA